MATSFDGRVRSILDANVVRGKERGRGSSATLPAGLAARPYEHQRRPPVIAQLEAGVLLAAEGLLPSSTGAAVHVEGPRRTVVDGPFTETKELIAGFWLIQVQS